MTERKFRNYFKTTAMTKQGVVLAAFEGFMTKAGVEMTKSGDNDVATFSVGIQNREKDAEYVEKTLGVPGGLHVSKRQNSEDETVFWVRCRVFGYGATALADLDTRTRVRVCGAFEKTDDGKYINYRVLDVTPITTSNATNAATTATAPKPAKKETSKPAPTEPETVETVTDEVDLDDFDNFELPF